MPKGGTMITSLKENQKNVTLTAKIETVYEKRVGRTKEGKSFECQNLFISDDTGRIKLTLWDKPEIVKEDTGKVISIKNGYVTENTWQGKTSLNLQAGKYSFVVVDNVGRYEEDTPKFKPTEDFPSHFIQPLSIETPMTEFSKENTLKIMDEIIRHLKDRRQEIAEM